MANCTSLRDNFLIEMSSKISRSLIFKIISLLIHNPSRCRILQIWARRITESSAKTPSRRVRIFQITEVSWRQLLKRSEKRFICRCLHLILKQESRWQYHKFTSKRKTGMPKSLKDSAESRKHESSSLLDPWIQQDRSIIFNSHRNLDPSLPMNLKYNTVPSSNSYSVNFSVSKSTSRVKSFIHSESFKLATIPLTLVDFVLIRFKNH